MKKRILICLERLDIGGVETSVLTQALEYKRRNYEVVILAKKGIYTKKLENKGVICINFDFKLENKFFIDSSLEIEKIVKKYKITEIHIHQYPCILHILPFLLRTNIPYVSFIHQIIDGVYEWFLNSYSVYNLAYPLYFKNASKIVTIREKEIDNNMERFGILDKSKYYILNNSFDFGQTSNKITSLDMPRKMLMMTRLGREKEIPIKTGIEFYRKMKKLDDKFTLSILGDGEYRKKLEEENPDIKFLGKSNNVFEVMNNYDIILGVDRCMLESICYKKIAIVTSYEGRITLINEKNIDLLSKENFSGRNLKKSDNIENKLLNMKKNEYEKIVNYNYNYAFNKFNISKNILDEKLEKRKTVIFDDIWIYSNNNIEKIKSLSKESNSLYNNGQKLYKIIEEKDKEINNLTMKIENLRIRDIIKKRFKNKKHLN